MISKQLIFCILMSILLLTGCSTTTAPESPISNKNVETAVSEPNTTAADYNIQLGMGYLDEGDVSRAKRKFLLAMDQAPDWPPVQEALGYFFENTGETNTAEKHYQKAIELDPTSGSAQNNYGTFLCKLKKYEEADKHFMLAVQDSKYLKTAEAYENAGLCAMQIPDNVKAAAYFSKAIAQDPKRSSSYLELAQINYQQGQYELAQKYFAQYQLLVSELDPEALWLGVRLARIQKDDASIARYSLLLQNRYPDSNEYKELRAAQTKTEKKPMEPQLKLPLFKTLGK